ncbi:putative membrane protein [Synechococcus sp. A15-44]|nr:putative membrane protein [Synechococcus sp. A15-44]
MEAKLLAMLAFGAAVMTLWAWLMANLTRMGSDRSKPDNRR